MDIYVINLDKDVQRLQWMDEQLSARQLKYVRIAAVNGAEILAQQHPYWSGPRRSDLGPAEIGCFLSHVNAWRLIAKADSEYALVLEDDVHLSDDFADFIRNIPIQPKELCVHKLETFCANVTLTRQPTYTVRNRRAHKLQSNHGGAGAYMLNRRTALHLLDHVGLFDAAMDIELFDPNRRTTKDLTIYQWMPAPCIQDFLVNESKGKQSFPSNIGLDRADVRRYALDRSKRFEEFFKSRLRMLYTTFYSFCLLPSGRMRRKVAFG